MKPPQRVVLILYCLSLAYCCLWIPWRTRSEALDWRYVRAGYGWMWAGPERYRTLPPVPAATPDSKQYLDETAEILTLRQQAVPDFALMGLRFLATTAVSAAALLLAGMWKSSAPR